MLSSYLLGDPEVFPGQIRYVIPPASSGSTPVSPPIGRTQKTSKGSHPGGILRCPNHLSWLLWTQRISGFTWPACIHNLILSITTQTHEHRWGLECRSIWKSIKLCLLVQHPFFFTTTAWCSTHITADGAPIRQLISCPILSSLVVKCN